MQHAFIKPIDKSSTLHEGQQSYVFFACLILEMATIANVLYVVLEQPYTCRRRVSGTRII